MKKIKRRFLQFAIVSLSLILVAAYRNYDGGMSFLPPEDGIYEYGRQQFNVPVYPLQDHLVEKGDLIYYVDRYTSDTLHWKKTDGTEKGEVPLYRQLEDGLNIVGEWVYFDSNSIYRIRLDGTGFEKVSNRRASSSLLAVNSTLYFLAYRGGFDTEVYKGLYKIDLETGKEVRITKEGVRDILIDAESSLIYYIRSTLSEDKALYCMNTSGKNVKKLNEGNCYRLLYMTDDYLYVTANFDSENYKEAKLYRLKKDGTGIELVCDLPAWEFHCTQNLFFINSKKDGYPEWYRVSTEGEGLTEFLPALSFNITNVTTNAVVIKPFDSYSELGLDKGKRYLFDFEGNYIMSWEEFTNQ